MKQIDILAIGDIATDVFIKIKDAEEKCDLEGNHCKLCLNYGGKIPYESAEVCHATGNSSNVAVSTSRLGLKAALMANMGDDQDGINCLDVLKKENVDTNFIKIEQGKPTNYHYVLWYDKERTILVKHEKYNYEWTNTEVSKEYQAPRWVYLSSLGENSLSFHNEIFNYLKNNKEVKLAFQPGTFQIKLGYGQIKDIYQRTDVFLCNHEEAETILNTEEKDISKLLKMVKELGPKIVVITDGIDGAYAYDGKDIYFIKSYTQNLVETTGAGDAFSSAFVVCLSLDKDIETALMWGAINAASIVSCIGPQKGLLTREQIDESIKNIPEGNKPIKII
jgi:sugar/nucleoside kinase (ribokinase family)